jgi:hypothetical protein
LYIITLALLTALSVLFGPETHKSDIAAEPGAKGQSD